MHRLTILLAPLQLMALSPWFEPNHGQAGGNAQFVSRSVYLAAGKAAIYADGKTIVLSMLNARRSSAEGLDPLPGVTNYYLGNDPKKWRSDIPHYGRVRYKNVYPGIDVTYYFNQQGRLEYDFNVGPGANPNAIQLAYNFPVQSDANGDLLVAGIRQRRPKVFQHGHEIACEYLVRGAHHVQLALARYDRSELLTVDPVIEYSTYLGGNATDVVDAIAVDSTNSAYITGWLESPKYPNLDPFRQASGTSTDVVVAKFTPSGNALVFYTYVGGTGLDIAQALALDAGANAYVTGFTQSADFPAKNAAQPNFGGGSENAIVFKISSSGKLVYSTYLGGNNQDRGSGIAVDAAGAAFVTGFSYSVDFPVRNALQSVISTRPDGFLAKLSPAGDQFLFATYLGGNNFDFGNSLTLDASGNPIVVGGTSSTDFPVQKPLQVALVGSGGFPSNGFITKFSSTGDTVLYSTYVGGAVNCAARLVALDAGGAIYIAGTADGDGFPVKNPIQSNNGGQTDLVLAKLTASGDSIVYATYLGGGDLDYPTGLAVDRDGTAYVTGFTYSPDFPTKDSLQPWVGSTHSFKADAFVARISPGGSLLYSTILGGNGNDRASGIAIDSRGAVHLVGGTNSDDFPTKNALQPQFGGGENDMFYVRLAPEAAPLPPFNVSPASVPFRYVIGGSIPAPQTVAITSSVGPLPFTPTSNAPWLKVASTGGTTPANLTLSIDPNSLKPGNYSGVVQIDSQTSVQVNLTVLAASPAINAVSPSSVPVGSDTVTITVSGSGFENNSAVQINSMNVPTTFVDSSTLRFTLDKSNLKLPLTIAISVVNPQSAPSGVLTFTIGTPAPSFTAASITNAATFATGSVAPGEIITIFGTDLDKNVMFDGVMSTLVYFSPTQVSVTVPYSVSHPTTNIQVGTSAAVKLDVAPSAPGIFAGVRLTDRVITLYATGCGALTKDELPRCALPVSVKVNDRAADVLYAGVAPTLVEGANQINISLPEGGGSGPLTIILKAGEASSPPFTLP